MSYDWVKDTTEYQIEKKQKRNKKTILTDRQWQNNSYGAMSVSTYEYSKIWDAVRDYYDSRSWE